MLCHVSKHLCAELGQHRSLLSSEQLGDNFCVFPFLKKCFPHATTGQGKD